MFWANSKMNEEDCGLLHSINHGVWGLYKTNWEWDEVDKQRDFTTDWIWETQWCFSLNILNLRGQPKKLGFKEHNWVKWPLLFFWSIPLVYQFYLSKSTESSEMPTGISAKWLVLSHLAALPPMELAKKNRSKDAGIFDDLNELKVGRVMRFCPQTCRPHQIQLWLIQH